MLFWFKSSKAARQMTVFGMMGVGDNVGAGKVGVGILDVGVAGGGPALRTLGSGSEIAVSSM